MTQIRHLDSEQRALAVVDAFVEASNAQDPKALFATFNFPHVRIASGRVAIWSDPAQAERDYMAAFSQRRGPDWHHTEFDAKEVVQSSEDKVHIAVEWTRYDNKGDRLETHKALYVVTCIDGHWGVQARSSFAP